MEQVKQMKLSIYTTEAARHDGHCLYEKILHTAKELHLSGITIYRGIAGYGKHGKNHTSRLIELSGNLPIVIDIIDEPEHIEKAVTLFVPWIADGMVIVSECVKYVSKEA